MVNFLFYIGFLDVQLNDIFDILLVALLMFQIYKLLKGSMAINIFIGIILIYLLYLIVNALEMELVTTILEQFMSVGVVAALILFQQEIRKFLLMIGKTDQFKGILKKKGTNGKAINLNQIVEAAAFLGSQNTGALIVFSKGSELKFFAESGDALNADISKRLLITIFQKNSPLHDGAVIISNSKIKAARCILPVTENDELPAYLGLRHRAALGMSEVTDSIILISSEETGALSLARDGHLYHNLKPNDILKKLYVFLYEDDDIINKEIEQTQIEGKSEGGNVTQLKVELN